ncbi:uncharacterized protein LOC133890450 [Phragmites australis]|uniref:uncharacterized protein LOC133890450 n=1 Tax=Phragmites australis TaxID=29695 RepID=UPI002D779BBC|nr:uncharacterized protein LOC133890450 [Phragmites australis]
MTSHQGLTFEAHGTPFLFTRPSCPSLLPFTSLIAVLPPLSLEFSVTVHISSEEDGSFYLTAVYGPNDENLKDVFLAELTAVCASLSSPWLIIGNFNMIADKKNANINRLRPRVLVDVSKIDMSTSLLGYDIPLPIIVAPTGAHKLANPEGEVSTARAAIACNTIMVLSFATSCRIEEVASVAMPFAFISYM